MKSLSNKYVVANRTFGIGFYPVFTQGPITAQLDLTRDCSIVYKVYKVLQNGGWGEWEDLIYVIVM